VQTERDGCRRGTIGWPIKTDRQHRLNEINLEEAVLRNWPAVVYQRRKSPLRRIHIERCSYSYTEIVSDIPNDSGMDRKVGLSADNQKEGLGCPAGSIVCKSDSMTMQENERIADQLKRAFYGDAWSGPCVKDVLDGVTAQMAAARAIPEAHSIWELVHHITAWVDIVRREVMGETLDVTADINFPPVNDTSDGAWQQSLKQMEDAEAALRNLITSIPGSKLDEPAGPDGRYTVYLLLHGAVQHSLYHAGQIMLMKRSLTTLRKTLAM
jgi:hypothetical protein